MDTDPTLPYCRRLGIAPPRVEDFLGPKGVSFLRLMVLALLERGEPMALSELAGRLSAAGVVPSTGDMEQSLLKAWHGLRPVFRDAQGRFGLDLSSRRLEFFLRDTGLRESGLPQPPPVLVESPRGEVPLTKEELETAFRDRAMAGFSTQRVVAAVLDAHGGSASLDAVNALIGSLAPRWRALTPEGLHYWRSDVVKLDESGRLSVNPRSPDLEMVRAWARALARPFLVRRARSESYAKGSAELELLHAGRRFREKTAAEALRRAVVRVVPDAERPEAMAVLDVNEHTIRTFLPGELEQVAEAIASFDLLAGIHVRRTLEALRLQPDRWRLVDLKPPRKTRRLNRQGRTLAITPELVLSGTTGIHRPLGDPKKVREYLRLRDAGKLARRLESDVKSLDALYRYGVLHRHVRLRWGFLDEFLHVEWSQPGEESLYDLLTQARDEGRTVDLVFGSPPGWSEPWARARPLRVVDVGAFDVTVENDAERFTIPRHDIHAARLAGGGEAGQRSPREPTGPPGRADLAPGSG